MKEPEPSLRFISKQALERTFHECGGRMWRLGPRQLPWGLRLDGGSDWVALHRDFCSYVALPERQDALLAGLRSLFGHTLLPAEVGGGTAVPGTCLRTRFPEGCRVVAVILPHGPAEQCLLLLGGGQQPAPGELEAQAGLPVPAPPRRGLVRLLAQRLPPGRLAPHTGTPHLCPAPRPRRLLTSVPCSSILQWSSPRVHGGDRVLKSARPNARLRVPREVFLFVASPENSVSFMRTTFHFAGAIHGFKIGRSA